MKLIISTGNANKVFEFKKILSDFDVCSMKEAGFYTEVEETGTTFSENSYLKAKALADKLSEQGIEAIAIADDSGLCVDAMDGGPGVYSSRFMGEDTPYPIKMQAIMDLLDGKPEEERGAHYVSAITAILPDGTVLSTEGIFSGRIGHEMRGSNGFGYDPFFFVPEKGQMVAEMSNEAKNEISHRGIALRKMKEVLADHFSVRS